MSKKSSHTNIDILLQCLSMTGPLRALLRGSTVSHFTCSVVLEIETISVNTVISFTWSKDGSTNFPRDCSQLES